MRSFSTHVARSLVCAKTAEPIEMPFRGQTRVDPKKQWDEDPDPLRKKHFWVGRLPDSIRSWDKDYANVGGRLRRGPFQITLDTFYY